MTAAEVQRVSASCALFSYSFKAGAAIWAPVKHQQLLNDGDHSGLVQRHRCVATAGGVSATRPGGGQKEGGGGVPNESFATHESFPRTYTPTSLFFF